ncbi:MAG TPA: methionyl-tRNA formyltransferase [Candidatus Acidoferrales bacterium]|nr:methionyl-tRNA formyltransferase [Candidatus Acidoferrales bacterium]
MRLILIGQAAFAEKVLDGLRAKGHEVLAVYCPPDPASGKADPVKARAQALGIAVRQHASLKRPEVKQEFEDLNGDLAVLAYVTQIVPQSVFDLPRLGSICFHPSLLPKYRGGSAIPWQLIKGETVSGVTVFWVDPGIDTGPILLQRSAAIDPDDTAGSLYFNKLFGLGVDTVIESVELIATGKAPRLPQDESAASYDPLCRDEHAAIDWSQPIDVVYNQIRGCDPQPGAYTLLSGEKLRLFDCRAVRGGAHQVGTVEVISAEGLLIGANGGAIRAKRVRCGDKKVEAAVFAEERGLRPGTQLG